MNRFIPLLRLTHKKIYIPAITIVAISLTLTFVVAIWLYQNIHRERLHIRETLEKESVAIVNVFSMLICSETVLQDSYQKHFQHFVQEISKTSEVAYIAFLDSQGKAIAHSGFDKNDVVIETSLPQTGQILTNLKEKEHIFELITEFHIDSSSDLQVPISFILLGLKTTRIEQAYRGDLKHAILMAIMLLVIGSASIYFIVIVQNYYLVDRALDQMKTYTHHIVSSMPNGLISFDKNGYITTFNRAAAEMLSHSTSEVIDQHFSIIFNMYADEIESVLKSGEAIIEREIQYTQRSGESVPLNLNATQLLDDTGNILGAVILLRDLREVKELQARAQRAEHLASIGRLASAVAHEIRNPLSSIRGFTQYFVSQFQNGTDEQKYAKVMMSEIDRLNRVIEEMLDYSRPLTLKRQETSVENIFNHTIQLIQSDADEKGIQIVCEFSADLPSIWVDSERIIQALLNVCLNAIAAIESDGTLTVSVRMGKQGDKVEIVIADTGSGITEADLPKVFEPFFTTKSSGTGLGLAIVRKIIDYHEGFIDIKSQLDVGTTVRISLPIQIK